MQWYLLKHLQNAQVHILNLNNNNIAEQAVAFAQSLRETNIITLNQLC